MREYFDGGRRRLWFDPAEIEQTMEHELRKAGLLSSSKSPAVDVEALISRHLKVNLDQYADSLDANVLGLTQFCPDGTCRILINRALSEEIDREDECPPGVRGRWRATMAHEAAHVLLHRTLFLTDPRQGKLFDSSVEQRPPALFRCLKRDVSHTPRTPTRSAPEEVQANMGMAALLMPRSIFSGAAAAAITDAGFRSGKLPHGEAKTKSVVAVLAQAFEVSKQAAAIRLQTLSFISKEGELELT